MYQQHIVLDFEMNPVSVHDRDADLYLRREIIEIGAVRLNSRFEPVGRFRCYVKPEHNDCITYSIRELTGIGYSETNSAGSFAAAMDLFTAWIGDGRTRVYSWSDSDYFQLDRECAYKGVDFPYCMERWVDLQAVFPRMLGQKSYRRLSLQNAAKICGVSVDRSKVHGALYDAAITAQILVPFLDGSYRELAAAQRELIRPEVSHASCSLDQASGGALQQLLEKMRAAERQGAAV